MNRGIPNSKCVSALSLSLLLPGCTLPCLFTKIDPKSTRTPTAATPALAMASLAPRARTAAIPTPAALPTTERRSPRSRYGTKCLLSWCRNSGIARCGFSCLRDSQIPPPPQWEASAFYHQLVSADVTPLYFASYIYVLFSCILRLYIDGYRF